MDLQRYAESDLPTENGPFRIVVYKINGEEHVALVRGDVVGKHNVPTRVHSECLTAEVFGSLKCDCREQLAQAMQTIAEADLGIIVYMRQEGRGIGLGNKIRAYALQDQGKDTVDANLELGFAADLRSYDEAAGILRELGVGSVALMTNNPEKLSGLKSAGVTVGQHLSHWVAGHKHNADYLEVKRSKMGHLEGTNGVEDE